MSASRDPLRPTVRQALAAWAARVRADREQVERHREVDDPADFYAPVADRFRLDPRRRDEPALEVLRELAHPDDSWLDIGAGGGRYALPLALEVRQVIAIEPSDSMVAVLRQGMAEHAIANVEVHQALWPMAGSPTADIALMAHIGYDIERIGPFLDAAETAALRSCVAVMGEGAMTTAATLFWQEIHGETRVPLPALGDLLVLLLARGRLPEVRLVDRAPPSFDSLEALFQMARRQLWLRPGTERDVRLDGLVREYALRRDGRWTLDRQPTRIGIVSWDTGNSTESPGTNSSTLTSFSARPSSSCRSSAGVPTSSGKVP